MAIRLDVQRLRRLKIPPMGKLAPNSATNQNQREFALPGGDLWWQARRMSSGTVVRRADSPIPD